MAGIRSIEMIRRGRRIGLLLAVLVSAWTLTATPASAFVSSHCHANAVDSTHKAVPAAINIDDTDTWNVSKDSVLSGSGTADKEQTFGYAYFSTFGYGVIHVAGGTGHGTTGQGSLDVSKYSDKVRIFPGIGASDSCSGHLEVVVTDESVLATLAGEMAVGSIVVGLLGLGLCMFCPDTIWEDWGP